MTADEKEYGEIIRTEPKVVQACGEYDRIVAEHGYPRRVPLSAHIIAMRAAIDKAMHTPDEHQSRSE